MELPPNDLNNNPFLRKELERGKSKADARFEDGPDNKRARALQSHARRALTPEPVQKGAPSLTDVDEDTRFHLWHGGDYRRANNRYRAQQPVWEYTEDNTPLINLLRRVPSPTPH